MKVPGFRAGAVCAGLRRDGGNQLDLALIVCDAPASAAGTFTRNKVQAAPVILSRKRLKSGITQAILANAGCANAMTGLEGMMAAKASAAAVAKATAIRPVHVLPASTGVIGTQLPVKKIEAAMPAIVRSLRPDGFDDASRAIMTTDKVPKTVKITFPVGKAKATLVGLAKGAGMIAPDMATMLAFLLTDARAEPDLLQSALREAVETSFNRVRVDGDTSTNDCALLLAGGAAGNTVLRAASPASKSLRRALNEACYALAEMMARDGEGATRIMDLRVYGAKSQADALKIGRAIADSPLVKTALHGADPNWGRIAAAAGRSGADMNPQKLRIIIGGIECVQRGIPTPDFNEKRAAAAMRKDIVIIEVCIGLGKASSRFLASDFSAEYIRINAHYRT